MKHDRTEDIERIINYLDIIGDIIGDMAAKTGRTLYWHSIMLFLIVGQVIYFSFKY